MGNPPLTRVILSGVRLICLSSLYQSQPGSPLGCWVGPLFSFIGGECCCVPHCRGALGCALYKSWAILYLQEFFWVELDPFVFLLHSHSMHIVWLHCMHACSFSSCTLFAFGKLILCLMHLGANWLKRISQPQAWGI